MLFKPLPKSSPEIKLDTEVKDILKKLAPNKLYLVTDGNKMVQQKKVVALELNSFLMAFILPTVLV